MPVEVLDDEEKAKGFLFFLMHLRHSCCELSLQWGGRLYDSEGANEDMSSGFSNGLSFKHRERKEKREETKVMKRRK
jgi:hypothetical protein